MPAAPAVDPLRVVALLPDAVSFRTILHTAQCGSTNVELGQLAKQGAVHGTLLVTESQTSGRGRFERSWEQTPGSCIAMSLLLRTDAPIERWGWLPLVAGLGVKQGIWQHLRAAGVTAQPVLKWPNDILINGPKGGKIVGILAERVNTDQGPAAIIGVGINVWLDETELPVQTASSLKLAGLNHPDKSLLIADVLTAWFYWYRRWQDGEDLQTAYADNCGSIGARVRVQLDEQRGLGPSIIGLATGVDGYGSLLVTTDDGSHHALSAGDVVHLRAS